MPEMKAHPSQEQLSAYNLGQLPPDEADVIESHINECEHCCDTIVSLSTDDTFVGLLKEARQLPTDQTVDHGLAAASSSGQDVPAQLAEHPRYEILGLIGKGGMGDVYKATHRMMKRTVAIKIIKPELMRKPEAVDRFHREVTTAAQLSHPNIVTAHDAEQAGDVHFLVMEYVDGTDLSQLVKDRGALPIPDACDYVRQAAIGLQHAHEQGMIHRDIKPHNLMVLADGTVKILDFGLASLAPEAVLDSDPVEARGDLTAAGAIMGTPDFISPEQADDARTADIRSDIYSLGTTLYFLLSAQPPFAEGSIMHKLKSHAQSDPKPLGTVRLDVPADLADVITRMMAKDPDERFQTPEEIAEALKPFSQSAETRVIVEPPTQAEPRRWMSTFLSRAAVAVLFVAAIFAGLIYFLQTNHGGVRVEVTPPNDQLTLGTHPLTIVDTSGRKPLGGTSGTRQDDAAGVTTHFFNSANGRYEITLVDELLTVNGDKYKLENPTDSIRIVDDRVEITRITVRSKGGEEPRDLQPEEGLKLLQGEWDVIAFTQNGKKEFAADKGVGMQLQIKGDTITRIQTRPDGEKSEKEWGRIELNSKTNPKSIDVVNPDGPDGRLLGIYELKDGTLTICFAERGNLDVAEGRAVKRPTKFNAPAGSELVLLECQRKRLENAALVYWQAFALLPELSGKDTKLLTDLEKGSELGVDARSLLTRRKTALSLISQLQPETPCRWELVEDGVNTLLPHLSKAQTLARLLVLQARADAESGKLQAAVDHLTQAFLVARNVDDGVLVQMIVGDSIESLAADVAFSLLPKLDAATRDRFAQALSKLPKRATFAQAIRHESGLFGRGAGRMMSDTLEQLGQDEESPAVRAILAATKAKQAMWLEELLAEYDKVIEASELPLAKANKELARLEAEIDNSSNPLIQLLMPSLVGTNQRHARVDARIAELKTRLGVAAQATKIPN